MSWKTTVRVVGFIALATCALLALPSEPARAAAGDFTEEFICPADAGSTELLVRHPTRRGALIQNGGLYSVKVTTGAQADGGSGATTVGIEIVAGGAMYVAGAPRMFCAALTAGQDAGAATRVLEVP